MILLGILHCLRGRGFVPRWLFFPLVALLAWLEFESALITAVVTAGIAFWIVPGLGKYFSVFTGRDDPKESEIEWIDWVGYQLFPSHPTAPGWDTRRNQARGLVCMSLRGLYLCPLFIALSAWNPSAAYAGLCIGLLQGPVYFLAGRVSQRHAVAIAELVMGTWAGALIGALL